MSVAEYQDYWTAFHDGNDDRLLYLKDWHYFRGQPISDDFYTTPDLFASDWMNEFWDMRSDLNNDDFRFVYLGPMGTWTPLHADVYRSYSWSSNIAGHKRWWLFPPGEEKKLSSLNQGRMPVDVRDLSLDGTGVEYFVVDQHPGQIVFVPSDWYHQVVNITDCLSINHNWFNACNINSVWSHLQEQLREVEEATQDVRDTPGWHEQCQICLRALTGLNFFEYFAIIKYILLTRWRVLNNRTVHLSAQTTIARGSLAELNGRIDAGLDELYHRDFESFRTACKQLDNWRDAMEMAPREVHKGLPYWIYVHDFVSAVNSLRMFRENGIVKKLGIISDGPLQQFIDSI